MDYKKTLNLPSTDFPMRAELTRNEPRYLDKWAGVYNSLRKKNEKSPKYILHDGPPYANGEIHIGHALNKILKDFVIKYKTLRGFDCPFIPGWDCHGLPVELRLLEELGLKKEEIDQLEFRRKARDFALRYVEIQKRDFIRLGVLGDWENPYLTLDPEYEVKVLETLASLVKEGYIYRGLKPVNWCWDCKTALAEAEVEYQEKESDSIYIKFKFLKCSFFEESEVELLVWTTTPWTLISNVAVALHPEMDYILVSSEEGNLVFAENLKDSLVEKVLTKGVKILKKFKGSELEFSKLKHPFLEREVPVVLGDFVSSEEGTGCVHIAPGHGPEDFALGKKYNLPVVMPVDEEGVFRDVGEFSGFNVSNINEALITRMQERKTLLKREKIVHSYPHCWRCKNPLIFRATQQWFLNVEHKNLRFRLLESIEKVEWVPFSGKERISSMLRLRPDWCLSRQRLWGVPIPAVRCQRCQKVYLEPVIILNLAKIVKEKGSSVWFRIDLREVLPENFSCSCGCRDFDKEKDIIDVWFESGVSFSAVVKNHFQLQFPSDLYLEGSDQHRGWFQVSLLPSVALEGRAPFKSVLTHGFVVDGEGRKMSKSLGNIISPQQIIEKYGAEILRLWVSYSDYREDVRISSLIIKQLVDFYRKIRNTLRFILGNLYDFSPTKELFSPDELLEVDRFLLSYTASLLEEVESSYENFLFYKVYQKIFDFCNITLSSFYLDILKNRLYTYSPFSRERKSAQTVLWYILNFLLKTMAPILSFTAEEAYGYFEDIKKQPSVFLSLWPDYSQFKDPELEEKWRRILKLRFKVLKALEEKRVESLIHSSLEAQVSLGFSKDSDFNFFKEYQEVLKEVFIVSDVQIKKALQDFIKVEKAQGLKCPRCWNIEELLREGRFAGVCKKCAQALEEIFREEDE